MRMTRHLALAVAPVLLLASCDPFDITDSRTHRPVSRHPDQRKPVPDEVTTQRRENDPRPVTERYPVAERTENPNFVISPYPPFNVIDVTGFNSGQLAEDPSTNKIFRVP